MSVRELQIPNSYERYKVGIHTFLGMLSSEQVIRKWCSVGETLQDRVNVAVVGEVVETSSNLDPILRGHNDMIQ